MTRYVAGVITGFGLGLIGIAGVLWIVGGFDLLAAEIGLAGILLATAVNLNWRQAQCDEKPKRTR